MNNISITGRLTRDQELKYTASGAAIGKFAVAVDRRVKQGDQWGKQASFFDCVLFGKMAESLGQYLTKGKQVGISGEMVQNFWESEGQKKSRWEVIVRELDLLGGKSEGQQQGHGPQEKGFDDSGFQSDIPF